MANYIPTDKEQVHKQLQEDLEKVNNRLHILDMIEERLLEMKKLFQKVAYEELMDKEIQEINKQVQNLEQQVKLLNSEATELS